MEEYTRNVCIGWKKTPAMSETYAASTVCTVIVNIVMSLCGTTANVLIILSYCKNRQLRVVENTLFTLLSLTDLTITACVQPIYIVALVQGVFAIYTCRLWFVCYATSSYCIALSLVTATILSGHSFVKLARPFHYENLAPYLNALILVSWLSVIIVVSFLTFCASQRVLFMTGACLIILTILTVASTWAWTYRLIRHHRRRIATTQTPSNFTSNLAAHKKVLRSTTTASIVVGGLMLCCLPGFARLLYEGIDGEDYFLMEYVLRPLSTTLMYANSLLNPCIVLWRSTEFREAAKRIFC